MGDSVTWVQVWIRFSGPAVNTSLYAYHPLSLRMIVLKTLSKPVGDIALD